MNTNRTRTVRLAGGCLAAAAATIGFATPAVAMLPPGPPAPPLQTQVNPTGGTDGTEKAAATVVDAGTDWAALTTGLAIGTGLTGGLVVIGMQSRQRHPHPA